MNKRFRSLLCFALLLSMLFGSFGSMPVFAAALEVKNGVVDIEAEKMTYDKTRLSVVSSTKLYSGGKALQVLTEDKDQPEPDAKAHIDLSFKADIAGTYTVWVRNTASVADTSGQSVYLLYGKDGKYNWTKIEGEPEQPTWTKLCSLSTAAGEIGIVKLRVRQMMGISFDRFIITTDTAKPDDTALGITKASAATPVPSSGPIVTKAALTTKDGSIVVEAEELTYNKTNFELVKDDKEFSGGKALSITSEDKNVPDKSAKPDIDLSFKADKDGTYNVWVRNKAEPQNSSGNSVFLSIGGADYAYLPLQAGTPKEFGWSKLGSVTVKSGEVGSVRLIRRQSYQIVFDKFIITANKLFTPKDMGGDPNVVSENKLPNNVYPKPSITPPPTHPRLMFTAKDIPTIKVNFAAEQNKGAYDAWQKALKATINSNLPAPAPGGTNYNAAVLTSIEALAFDYAINGTEESGKKSIEHIKNVMNSIVFDTNPLVDRSKSPLIFTMCEVYDWCYPLMTDAERKVFIAYIEDMAGGMEGGYPLNKMGNVCGHGGEQILLHTLLGFGIATYNERPDIYNLFAGRILSEFVPARNYMYTSHGHNQGNAYGDARGMWEINSAWLFKQMSGQDIYSAEQQYYPYTWMYSRRPDGQVFRMGDDYWQQGASKYWSGWSNALFLVGNYYNDPYLKREYARENPMMSSFFSDGSMTAIAVLAYNKPSLEGKPATQLPLSKYFAYPKGMMIARTGWNDGINSPDVVAMMNIGEHWGSNHDHLESGSFQLYYKGILASESGQYSDGYGTEHDKNYNKRGIAHNILTIYDPNEKLDYYGAVANDGGQRTPANGAEPATLENWKDPTYDTGKVLDHEIGPDPMKPEYTYIKGDITKAYSDKVSGVLRSMVFLPLQDADHPATMIIMDKIDSKDASFKKSWLLHTQEEPKVEGNKTIVTRTQKGYNGKMVVETLLPKNPKIEAIGGEGKQFWIDGKNYAPNKLDAPSTDSEADAWGRVEVSPSETVQTDYFLNVMTVSDADTKVADLSSTLIEGNSFVGAVVSDRVAIFGKDAARMESTIQFTIPGTGEYKVFVAGVKEGTWTTADGHEIIVSKDGGAAYFNADAGDVILTYKNDSAVKPVVTSEVNSADPVSIRISKSFLYSDVKPVVIEGRTLIPMRVIFEKMGAEVAWDDVTKTATATKGGIEIKITEDSKTAYVAGEAKELDVPATILDGRFVVPVRFVSEAMGAKVNWDPFANLVDIVPGVMPRSTNKEGVAQIVNSKWSGHFENQTGDLTYDGDPESLWAVEGDGQWVQYEFKEPTTILSVYILLNKATERQAYFDIQSSDDGENFTTVLSCTGNGKTDGEVFKLKEPVKAKHFRILCKGNNTSKWNAIKEIEFNTK